MEGFMCDVFYGTTLEKKEGTVILFSLIQTRRKEGPSSLFIHWNGILITKLLMRSYKCPSS